MDLPSFRSRNVDVSALSILTRKYPYVYISVESPYIQQKLGISVNQHQATGGEKNMYTRMRKLQRWIQARLRYTVAREQGRPVDIKVPPIFELPLNAWNQG